MGGVAWQSGQLRYDQLAADEDQGVQISGSVGALASRLFVKINPTRTPKPDNAKIWRKYWGVQGSNIDT